MKVTMPIGIDDFMEARQGYYLVDKTGFLVQFLPAHPKVLLMTRPRRFGKTMTLSMLRYFLDIDGADEHRQLFDGMAVSRDAVIMTEMGTRPVLFFTMRGWKAMSWTAMQDILARGLKRVAQQYKFLMESDRVDEEDRADLRAIYTGKASIATLQAAPELLLRMLAAHYGKKAVLLLDEYDVPIQSSWEYDYYEEAIDFFRGFLTTALKSNPALDFAVLTGVLRISKESIFSDLNNLDVDSLLHMTYPTLVGFTTAEVTQMAEALGVRDKLPELRDWYDGYRFGGQEIYNPWSIIQYFGKQCVPGMYWVNTSGNAVIAELMKSADSEHFESIEQLMQGKMVRAFLREDIVYSDIGEDQDALYTMLCTAGYLTIEREERTSFGTEYTLRLPNREMQVLFGDEIVKRYQKGFGKSSLVRLMRALLSGDVTGVQDGLSQYLEKLASLYDTARGKESFYHGFILGMIAILVPEYIVRSNRESGYGRYDLAIVPKEKGRPGCVLEFKTAETEEKLEQKATEALEQIRQKSYMTDIEDATEVIWAYGIVFCGKRVCVKRQE